MKIELGQTDRRAIDRRAEAVKGIVAAGLLREEVRSYASDTVLHRPPCPKDRTRANARTDAAASRLSDGRRKNHGRSSAERRRMIDPKLKHTPGRISVIT